VVLSETDKEYQETTLHEYLDEMEVRLIFFKSV
jgi:hypothetical protein